MRGDHGGNSFPGNAAKRGSSTSTLLRFNYGVNSLRICGAKYSSHSKQPTWLRATQAFNNSCHSVSFGEIIFLQFSRRDFLRDKWFVVFDMLQQRHNPSCSSLRTIAHFIFIANLLFGCKVNKVTMGRAEATRTWPDSANKNTASAERMKDVKVWTHNEPSQKNQMEFHLRFINICSSFNQAASGKRPSDPWEDATFTAFSYRFK